MPVKQALKSRILDEKDKKILMLLQGNGRESLTNIAKKVKLSIDSVNKRIKEMQAKEIFSSTILINPRKIGYDLISDTKIKLKNVTETDKNKFINYLKAHDKVPELLEIMGEYDFTCVIIAKNSDELEQTSTEIRQKFNHIIDAWKSILVLKAHKFEEYRL